MLCTNIDIHYPHPLYLYPYLSTYVYIYMLSATFVSKPCFHSCLCPKLPDSATAQKFEAAANCDSMCRDQHPAFTLVPDLIEITVFERACRKRMKKIQQPDGKVYVLFFNKQQETKQTRLSNTATFW